MSQSTTLGTGSTTDSQTARRSWLALAGLILVILAVAIWPAPSAPVGDSPAGRISPTMAYVREAGAAGVRQAAAGQGDAGGVTQTMAYVREATGAGVEAPVGPLTHVREAPAN